jgi:large subunit ribosomal protein L9
MKVILLEKVERLGERGDIVEVADGYARNFLIPKKLAVAVTPATLKRFEAEEEARKRREEKAKVDAEKLAKKIEKLKLKIEVKVGEDDKLFGAVSSIDILNALKEKGIEEVEKGMIVLPEPIKALGDYEIPVKLHRDVEVKVKVSVVKKE